jgi:hypothetical protein
MKNKGFYENYTDEPNLTFSFCHSTGAERTFVYSGILDIAINKDHKAFMIKHHSTYIIVEGVNLYDLYKDMCKCLATDIKEGKKAVLEGEKFSIITAIKYLDAVIPKQ